jgi:hypothetical protein
MSEVTQETILTLLPLESPLVSSEQISAQKTEPDAWLTNENASLVDNLYQAQDKIAEQAKHNRIHTCQKLTIKQNNAGYELETEHGVVQLENGDIIALAHIQFLVDLQSHTVSTPDSAAINSERAALPASDDDIWSGGDVQLPTTHIADPFAQQHVISSSATQHASSSRVAHETNLANLPNIPNDMHYGLVETSDPLGFLYPAGQQPVATSSSVNAMSLVTTQSYLPMQANQNQIATTQPQANVLHDLGINEQSSSIASRKYSQHQPTYAEQSPMDMLDDYLTLDESMPTQHSSTYKAVQTQSSGITPTTYYAPTIHDDETSAGLFGSIKRFLSRKKN